MLNSIIVGLLMASVTIAIHAGGTTFWINQLRKSRHRSPRRYLVLSRLRILCTTATALLSLHIFEVVVWGFVYMALVGGKAFDTFEEAVYFSTVTFASLGYGDVVIAGSWRLLSAIQSMVGLLAFGWSSALLFAVVQKMLQANDSVATETDAPEARG